MGIRGLATERYHLSAGTVPWHEGAWWAAAGFFSRSRPRCIAMPRILHTNAPDWAWCGGWCTRQIGDLGPKVGRKQDVGAAQVSVHDARPPRVQEQKALRGHAHKDIILDGSPAVVGPERGLEGELGPETAIAATALRCNGLLCPLNTTAVLLHGCCSMGTSHSRRLAEGLKNKECVAHLGTSCRRARIGSLRPEYLTVARMGA